MHYVCHVTHTPGADLDEIMEPYSESLAVDPYKVYFSDKDIASAHKWYLPQGQDFEELIPDNWCGRKVHKDEEGQYTWETSNPDGHWDFWSVGGRWEGYFNGSDTVTAFEAWMFLNTAEHTDFPWKSTGPYVYLTAEGEWISQQSYNPDGEGYDDNDPKSVFPPNPHYKYKEYLDSVKDSALMVTTVDCHN